MQSDFQYYPCPDFPQRYISPVRLQKFLHENLSEYSRQLGTSTSGRPITMLSMGSGPVKIIAWSQMHGNESNATHALLDLLESFKHQPDLTEEIFSKISLDFILQLNPDGSSAWTRRNALDIDLNRDFLKLASKELPLLKATVENGNYDYALNLHEQRTIFTTDDIHPATLSFLAPSENFEREITVTRKKTMAVVSHIYAQLKNLIPNRIGRYTDEFYPSSTGDNFIKMGLPTVLFEGGHWVGDYQRKATRQYYTVALYEALRAMGDLKGSVDGWERYREIPENRETHYDIIYRNVTLHTDFPCVLDVAIQFQEIYKDGDAEITFEPIVVEVGDCGRKKGWQEIDCTGRFFKSENKFPKLHAPQNFEII